MNAEIVTIGTELLLGEIVDTNSAYIARQLRDIGVNIFYTTTVGDNLARIEAAIRDALRRSDVVITTGGLGPTVDDVTRQAVANATDRALVFSDELLEQIRERFRQFGARMSDNNRIQAYLPEGATPVHNRMGTAPCFIVETTQGTVISLPGVPREMKHLMEVTVLPYLRERTGGKGIIKALILRTAGIGESHIDAKIADLETGENPTVGLAAHSGQTDIRVTARADTEQEADALIAGAEAVIRERLAEYIYGTGDEPLDRVLVQLLRDKRLTLAVSYTGPDEMALTDRFALDEVLVESVSDADFTALLARLGLPEDTLITDYADLARAEARRLQESGEADVCIAYVTRGGGTGLAVALGDHVRTRQYVFDTPMWAGTWAISLAWHLVKQAQQ